MAEQDQERTEQATTKKRRDARQKGNVVKSHDVVAALSLLGAASIVGLTLHDRATFSLELVRRSLGAGFLLQTDLDSFSSSLVNTTLLIVAKLALLLTVVVVSSIAANLLQSGFMFLPKKCAPDFSKLSPFKNLERLFSIATLGQTFFGLIKLAIVLGAVYFVLRHDWETFVELPQGTPIQIVLFLSKILSKLTFLLCGVLLGIATIDYCVKRWKYEQDLRMTQQELRDELREESGNPLVKGKRRQMSRSLTESVASVSPPSPSVHVSPFRKNDRSTGAQDKKEESR